MSESQAKRDMSSRPSRFSDAEPPGRDRSPADKNNCSLYVSGLPYGWTWKELKDFFMQKVGDLVYADMFTGSQLGKGILEFKTPEACARAERDMNGIIVDGRKIFVKTDHNGQLRKAALGKVKKGYQSSNMGGGGGGGRPPPGGDQCRQPEGPFMTYGLNENFLQALDIMPPLINLAFISNLDYKVDKAKLKEIFKMAGKIHNINVNINSAKKVSAVIEFNHPVEVVQAISMFNKQTLYGRHMIVRMYRGSGYETKLPDGLGGVGPGLGTSGSPLREVSCFIEKQLSETTPKDRPNHCEENQNYNQEQIYNDQNNIGRPVSANPAFNNMPMQSGVNNPIWSSNANTMNMMSQGLSVSSPAMNMPLNANMGMNSMAMKPMGMNAINPLNANIGLAVPGMAPNMQAQTNVAGLASNAQTLLRLMSLQSQLQQQGMSVADMATLLTSMGGQATANSNHTATAPTPQIDALQHAPSVTDNNQGHRSKSPMVKRPPASDMVNVTNLPPSVTANMLHDKFGEAGPVKFVDMTGPGVAYVRFQTPWDAEQAIKMFDKTRVDGKILEVNFF